MRCFLHAKDREEARIVALPLAKMTAFELLAEIAKSAAERRLGNFIQPNETLAAVAGIETFQIGGYTTRAHPFRCGCESCKEGAVA